MKGSNQYNLVAILAIITSVHCFSKSAPAWIHMKNLVDTFDGKHLQQFSLTVINSLSSAFKNASEGIVRLNVAVVALKAIESQLRNAKVSKEDNQQTIAVENEPSITFGLADNIKNFWTIFETVHRNWISSQYANNNGRLVFLTMWPESVNEDVVPDLIENSIRTNPLLRKFSLAFGIDKNTFIIFHIHKNLTNACDLLHIYELYFIKDLLVIERVRSNILEDMMAFKLRRSNFRKVPIISVTQLDDWFYAKYTNMSRKIVLTGGPTHDILDYMSWKLNFTPTNILGNGWIDRTPDGSLSGMGVQLLNGEADMILSRSEVLEYRVQKLSTTHALNENRIKVYFKKPVGVSVRDIYFTTFAPELWLAISIMWLVIGATFVLFVCFKRKISSNNETRLETITWSDIVLWFIGSASMQGWNSAPSETSLRIIFVWGKYATFIMYAIFSSFMMSRLSVEKNLINSLEDLKRDGFELYSQYESIYSLGIINNIMQKSNISNIELNVKAGIEKVNNSKAAFITAYGLFLGMDLNTSTCSFNSDVKVESARVWSSLYFRKNDPSYKFFDYQITKWDERGLLKKTQIDYLRATSPMCDGSNKQEVYLISLFDVATPFIIFGVGALISIFCIIMELYGYSRRLKTNKNKYENTCKVCNK